MNSAGQTAANGRRGKPLTMLFMVLALWTGGRIMLWESPWPQADALMELASPLLADSGTEGRSSPPSSILSEAVSALSSGQSAPRKRQFAHDHSTPVAPLGHSAVFAQKLANAPIGTRLASVAMGHQSLWMAAMAYLPVPQSLEQNIVGGTGPRLRPAAATSVPRRWSIDSWAYWRQGSGAALVSQGRTPTYGASQAGAVLNYRLAPSNQHGPKAYVRAYRALIDNADTELALGLSARPVANVPIRAHAEMRATQRDGIDNIELRPSAFATTELAPQQLPLGARAELYAQAGYVGGNDATFFADGQLHVLRDVRRFDLGQLSVGAGAWGGAQKGAERVDVGPTMRLDMTIGSVPARVSIDYRERIAGSAEPDSGAAVTLSTRF